MAKVSQIPSTISSVQNITKPLSHFLYTISISNCRNELFTMLQTVRDLGPRRLTRLTSNYLIVTTNLSLRTGRHASLSSMLQSPARPVSNVKPLILSRFPHAKCSTTNAEEEGIVKENVSYGDLLFVGVIYGVLGCVTFVGSLVHFQAKREAEKRWIAVFETPSYQSWIKTTNLCSCATDRIKEPAFAQELAKWNFKYTVHDVYNYIEYGRSRAQKKIILGASYSKLVYEAGLCDRCQQSLLDSKDRFAELILLNEPCG